MTKLNLREAEMDAESIRVGQCEPAVTAWARDFSTLAALYREAVEALERRRIPGVPMEPDADAVLAKAREVLNG